MSAFEYGGPGGWPGVKLRTHGPLRTRAAAQNEHDHYHNDNDHGDLERPDHVGGPTSLRPMMWRWIWLVPSTICRPLASRMKRSTGYSVT